MFLDIFYHFKNVFRYCFLFVYNLLLHYTQFVWYNECRKKKRPEKRGIAEAFAADSKEDIMQEHHIRYRFYQVDSTAYARLYTYAPVDEKTCAVTGYDMASPVCLMIPARSPDGRTVVAIADRAFEGSDTLRAVYIPDSVERIGRRAFAFCAELRAVRLGENSRLSTIGDRAFMGCERITRLNFAPLSSLSALGRHAFAHCTALRSVILPEGLCELSESLFDGCVSLARVHLPESLRRIRTGAFAACTALSSLRLPAAVAVIEDCAFAWCDHLSDLALPEGACLVSGVAFKECTAMPDLLAVG